jgi:hypothetical protein
MFGDFRVETAIQYGQNGLPNVARIYVRLLTKPGKPMLRLLARLSDDTYVMLQVDEKSGLLNDAYIEELDAAGLDIAQTAFEFNSNETLDELVLQVRHTIESMCM